MKASYRPWPWSTSDLENDDEKDTNRDRLDRPRDGRAGWHHRNEGLRPGVRLLRPRHRKDTPQESGNRRRGGQPRKQTGGSRHARRTGHFRFGPDEGADGFRIRREGDYTDSTVSRRYSRRARQGWQMMDAHGRNVGVAFGSLLASSATLLCCVLPAVLVSVGAGAVLVGLVSAIPQLVWLSEHKALVFGMAGALLAASGVLLWRARRLPCPVDPVAARSCTRLRRVS